jgi:hypothetical protein
MKLKAALILIAVTFVLLAFTPVYAQSPSDVGTPAFKQISSKTMTLKYGFKGASVYDNSLKKWVFHKMTTITRGKVEGYVNMINDNFALAAGLHEVAVYDYSKHKWMVYSKKGGADDSTGMLNKNFELTPDYAKVKILNGPFIKYTSASGWDETK